MLLMNVKIISLLFLTTFLFSGEDFIHPRGMLSQTTCKDFKNTDYIEGTFEIFLIKNLMHQKGAFALKRKSF